jgi:hypothetical protein
LLVDVCGGKEPVAQSVENGLFPQAFPGSQPRPLAGDNPLVGAGLPGMQDLSHPHVRQYSEQEPGFMLTLPGLFSFGYGHVIYSRLDLTSGLLGTGTWGINGYTADYSTAFMQNVLLWTARGQKEN